MIRACKWSTLRHITRKRQMKLKTIAVALIAMIPAVSHASYYCFERSEFAKQVVIARDAGVRLEVVQDALKVFIETEPYATAAIDASIVREAYVGRFSNNTPDGYAYRVSRACEVGHWEARQ